MGRSLALVVAALLGTVGCKSRWTAEVKQPPLLLDVNTALRTSMPLTIGLRDMQLGYLRARSSSAVVPIRLRNTAYYVVVSRDRLRFHVTLQHKWESMSDLRTWQVWVEDARGVRHDPEDIHLTRMVPLDFGGVQIYVGVSELTVYERNLFAAGQRVTLVLHRAGYEYRYVWSSEDEDTGAAGVALALHAPPHADP